MTRRALLLLITLTAGGAASIPAGDHPDLTGTWKMDAAGRPAGSAGPREVILKIRHQDPAFSYEATGRLANATPFSEAYSFTTDGKLPAGDEKVKVVGQWEGEMLTTRYLIGGKELAVVQYRLSPDGNKLTREQTIGGKSMGRETYDRQ